MTDYLLITSKNNMKKIIAIATTAAMFAFAAPASAAINSSAFFISTTNRGTITNVTQADSNTGSNLALGSVGGSGARGGDITSSGSNNNGGTVSGNGGNGGNGGAGGLVNTGNATSNAGTENGMNGTDVDVDLTGAADDINSSTLDIVTDNNDLGNTIDNFTDARSRTGDNVAEGSVGGNAERGGEISGGVGDFNNGGATSGSGGAGGAGGLGGTIGTGAANATSGTINLLNTTLVRVRI